MKASRTYTIHAGKPLLLYIVPVILLVTSYQCLRVGSCLKRVLWIAHLNSEHDEAPPLWVPSVRPLDGLPCGGNCENTNLKRSFFRGRNRHVKDWRCISTYPQYGVSVNADPYLNISPGTIQPLLKIMSETKGRTRRSSEMRLPHAVELFLIQAGFHSSLG